MDENTTTETSTTAAAWPRVTIGDEFDIDSMSYIEFSARVLRQGIGHVASRRWPTTATSLDAVLPHAAMTVQWRAGESALLELGSLFGSDALAFVSRADGALFARVGARDLPVVTETLEWLVEQFPEREPEERAVPVVFWSIAGRGGYSHSRSLEVPPWEEVRDNYPASVAAQLSELLATSFSAGDGGKLVLWHGIPGTGKTHALRALAWEWKKWCELHYVTDPEYFFGGRTDYLLDVVLREPDDDEGKWRLLVFEDTGELLAADAKERTGQGLSRLLNVVDGIIGQGLRVLVLVTTNESLKRLHPAVARPGRCAAKIEFLPFPAEEAGTWLEAHGVTNTEVAQATLAELFARAAGKDVELRLPIGFGA
jgi:hypothetical protein